MLKLICIRFGKWKVCKGLYVIDKNTIPVQEVASTWQAVVATDGYDPPEPWHVIHDVFYADATAWSHSWCHSRDRPRQQRGNHLGSWLRTWAGWIPQAMSWTRNRRKCWLHCAFVFMFSCDNEVFERASLPTWRVVFWIPCYLLNSASGKQNRFGFLNFELTISLKILMILFLMVRNSATNFQKVSQQIH